MDLIQHNATILKLASVVSQIEFQLDLPRDTKESKEPAAAKAEPKAKKEAAEKPKGGDKPAAAEAAPAKGDKPAKAAQAKGGKQPAKKEATPEAPVDIARVSLKVGKIVSVENHPSAERLFVEKIDLVRIVNGHGILLNFVID